MQQYTEVEDGGMLKSYCYVCSNEEVLKLSLQYY